MQSVDSDILLMVPSRAGSIVSDIVFEHPDHTTFTHNSEAIRDTLMIPLESTRINSQRASCFAGVLVRRRAAGGARHRAAAARVRRGRRQHQPRPLRDTPLQTEALQTSAQEVKRFNQSYHFDTIYILGSELFLLSTLHKTAFYLRFPLMSGFSCSVFACILPTCAKHTMCSENSRNVSLTSR